MTPEGTPHAAHALAPEHARTSAVRDSNGGRVLMLVENNSYPEDPRVRCEARALVEAGYQVIVISPARRGQRWRETVDGVVAYRYPAPPPATRFMGYLLEYGYATAAMLVLSVLVHFREGFDVIHAANPPDTLVFVAAAYKLPGKAFFYAHHALAPEPNDLRSAGASTPPSHRTIAVAEIPTPS